MKTEPLVNFPPQDEKGPAMKGADVVVECLEREGVDVIFAYPGGSSIELHQALTRAKKLRTILPRHEQGGGFMAHGYARATGKPGVCMATSGPGATNLVTCIADAFMDSIPLVAITGQVFQEFIGKTAFQETDFFGMTLPVVKHSFLVLTAEELPIIIKKAFIIATTGRPGPVVIDIPKDVQQKVFEPVFPSTVDIPGYPPLPEASDEDLRKVLDLITQSKQPALYTGGGVISAHASDELREFAKLTGIPVASTLMGLGALPPDDPQSLYWFGMHGTVAGNWAVCDSDLLICVGARFDDRITGTVSKFAPDATIVHFDIDRSEHNKNKPTHFPIHTDLKYALKRMIELIKAGGFTKPDLSAWYETINGWKKQHPYPFSYKESDKYILAQDAVKVLYEETHGDAIISTGVGQHQMWAPQYYHFKEPRHFISSLGLGTMGFGLPAALGAKIAFPEKTVVNIEGDGSFQMNIQELATAKIEKIDAKVMLLNNQHLGMVVQWEDRFYDGVRGHTILCDPNNIGSPDNLDAVYPDFAMIAQGYGIAGRRVYKKEDLRPAIKEMLEHDGPYVLDVLIPYTEHVLPFIPQKKSAKDILTE
ncbi:biosynthetic-type acetolactate synthase large subunit [Ruficoccus amylovorans]|uniref:Acetolactate synthase n=1 Tax=Ruficoccus amylovorans TaxID=1804625 RepID=A0A842HBH2_9BACT|nr:biosynthetic-type acetolactate synthase large subunit [Ruficoccus amylovorans]MBC2593418.1 biosynthetic-type acetolactate synthase large subunit [Ruficoccus amylovorans]